MKDNSLTLAQAIEQGAEVWVAPEGSSMKPLLDGKNDRVKLVKPVSQPKKGDLLLYRDFAGRLVVHRVHKADAENDKYYMLGDSNIKIEPPLSRGEILGTATEICRKGHYFSTHNIFYRMAASIWSKNIRYRKAVLFHLVPKAYSLKND